MAVCLSGCWHRMVSNPEQSLSLRDRANSVVLSSITSRPWLSEPHLQSLWGGGGLSWTEGLAGQHQWVLFCSLSKCCSHSFPCSHLSAAEAGGCSDFLLGWGQSHSQAGMPPFRFHPNIAAQDSQSLDTSVSKGGHSAHWIPRISKIKRKQITIFKDSKSNTDIRGQRNLRIY